MRNILLALLVGLAPCASVFAQERGGGPETGHAPGIVKTESQINAELDRSKSALGIVAGQVASVVETGTGLIVVRRRQEGPNNASVHNDLTEIYNVVSGSGTFVTGGAIANPEDRTAGISGGVARHIEAGDFVVLPPGTPHWFSKIDGSITYVETRFAIGEKSPSP
jgi:mannose-6-phosphate isomerase-like protein (cupin superfamily)